MVNTANYAAPLVEVVEVELERGLAESNPDAGGGTTDPGNGDGWPT